MKVLRRQHNEHDPRRSNSKNQKCLALAKSANENEAAIALRQAQALMREFQIDPDLLDIVEASCESKATKVPQAWEASLVMTIARAMQCKPIFSSGSSTWGIKASWTFIGIDPAPEVASYTFDVLYRQVIRSRKSFIENSLKRVSVKRTRYVVQIYSVKAGLIQLSI